MNIIRLTLPLYLAFTSFSFAQTSPKTLNEPDVLSELQDISQSNLPKMSKSLIIDGAYLFDGWFVVTDKIVFKKNSQLVFSKQAQNKRQNFYIVAKEISSEDNGSPGLITYEKPPVDISNAIMGQAPSGAGGPEDGDSGRVGQSGAKGSTGPRGFNAPNITITLLSLPTSGPEIDFSGGQGGVGGKGQKGGDGGAGHQGSPASQSAFDCKAGGGDGGRGGDGGPGGDAGDGGTGGIGGTVKIIAPAELLPSLSEKTRTIVQGGPPGEPGVPGDGGNAGSGGAGGQEAKPYCGGGSGGGGGTVGTKGQPGQKGKMGNSGDLLVGSISKEQFATVYK